tara:strand:+ start:7436 stop:7927 length:492 start_codon:yes stop_codon:yes gene_type:complete
MNKELIGLKILLPDADITYIENFYAKDEVYKLFHQLAQTVAWRQDDIRMFGNIMKIPRLQAWYGDHNLHYRYSNMTLIAKPWTASLLSLKAKVSDYCQHNFNAVLANMYRNQHDSVGWYSDNEPELGKMPVIASLSFGAKRDFQLKHIKTQEKKTLFLIQIVC